MKRSLLIVLALISAAALSCTKESLKITYANQEKYIEDFINDKISADETSTVHAVSNGGVQRLVMVEGEGEELASGGMVTFYYAGYVLTSKTITSSNLFATNIKDIAEAASWFLSWEDYFEPVVEDLSDGKLVSGLKKGIKGVKAGEVCFILFSGKYGYGDKQYGTIPANAALAYYVEVVDVNNNE